MRRPLSDLTSQKFNSLPWAQVEWVERPTPNVQRLIEFSQGGAEKIERISQKRFFNATYQNRPLALAVTSSKPFSPVAATNGGSSSKTLSMPRVRVVLFNHALQPHGLYSAVETGITFLSLPLIFTFLPPSFAYPATSFWAAGGGRLNV